MDTIKSLSLILIGIIGILYLIKKPSKTLPSHNILGIIGGFLIIILGILSLLNYIEL
jgi:hypothetical protein